MSIFQEVTNALENKHDLTMRDISNFQGDITEATLGHPDILACKATEGIAFQDHTFARNWELAKNNDQLRIAYHVAHPSLPAQGQVQFFLDYVTAHGLDTGDMLCLDLEMSDGLNPSAVNEWAVDWCNAVAYHTRADPIVYTFLSFAEAGNCDGLGDRPLWIADPSSPKGRPRIPHPWSNWVFHQYGLTRGVDSDTVNATSRNQILPLGVLPETPPPSKESYHIELSDGTAKVMRDVEPDKLRGFELTAGTVVLKIS